MSGDELLLIFGEPESQHTKRHGAKLPFPWLQTRCRAEGRANLEDADASATQMRLLDVKDENRRRLDLQQPLFSQEFPKSFIEKNGHTKPETPVTWF